MRPADPDDATAAVPTVNPPKIDRVQVRIVSGVGGFHLAKKTETLIAPPGDRYVQVKLADDSGAPLAELAEPTAVPAVGMLAAPSALAAAAAAATSSPVVILTAAVTKYGPTAASAVGVRVKRGRTWDVPPISLPVPDRSYELELARGGRLPTLAIGNGIPVDPSATFQPFGPQPQPGSVFLFACPEVFAKPGAKVTIWTEASGGEPAGKKLAADPVVRWEYWNGSAWTPLPDQTADDAVRAFRTSGEIRFTVPANLALKTEFAQEQLWVRAVLAEGGYLVTDGGLVKNRRGDVLFDLTFPPVVRKFRIEYEYTSPAEAARACHTFNDFAWEDRTPAAAFGGSAFEPFRPAEEARPTVYFGFTRALPADLLSLFVRAERTRGEPELTWEYHDGRNWRRLALDADETRGLSQPGMVRFVWPGTPLLSDPLPVTFAEGPTVTFLDGRAAARFKAGDLVAVFENDTAEAGRVIASAKDTLTLSAPLTEKFTAAATADPSPLARFGTPRHWVRVVWPGTNYPRPGDPDALTLRGIYANAVWAEQTESVSHEAVRGTTGTAGEMVDLALRPVLAGETVEVLELTDGLANAGWEALQAELRAAGRPDTDLAVERNPTDGKVERTWVRWEGRPNFAGSGPHDRHYTLDRTAGRVQFGDGRAGRVPPVHPNNVRVTYRSGGGRKGNVAARAVGVVLGA